MKKFILIWLSMIMGYQLLPAMIFCQSSSLSDKQAINQSYDEFDALADADVQPPVTKPPFYLHLPSWMKRLGIFLLIKYAAMSEFFSRQFHSMKAAWGCFCSCCLTHKEGNNGQQSEA